MAEKNSDIDLRIASSCIIASGTVGILAGIATGGLAAIPLIEGGVCEALTGVESFKNPDLIREDYSSS